MAADGSIVSLNDVWDEFQALGRRHSDGEYELTTTITSALTDGRTAAATLCLIWMDYTADQDADGKTTTDAHLAVQMQMDGMMESEDEDLTDSSLVDVMIQDGSEWTRSMVLAAFNIDADARIWNVCLV